MLSHSLIVSEMFYSLQGEGPCIGHPAVFLRLAACNLNCAGFSYKNPEDQSHLGCDTKLVWRKGKPLSCGTILDEWEQKSWLDYLKRGAHCIITGGEPLLQQKNVTHWIKALDQRLAPYRTFIEIETNGTLLPHDFLIKRVDQFNVSPKLMHSGETRKKARHEDVLISFAKIPNAIFKFVVRNEKDVDEIIEGYQKVFSINNQCIWLMPEGGTLACIAPKLKVVAELCKAHQFNFSPRLHIHIWDEATGV